MPAGTYQHGSYFQILQTPVVSIVPTPSAIPWIIGTAPIHKAPGYVAGTVWAPSSGSGASIYAAGVQTNLLVESYQEFVNGTQTVQPGYNGLGVATDFQKWTLSGWVDANFIEGDANSVGIVVNVFDPGKHFTMVAPASFSVVNGIATIAVTDVIYGSEVVKIGAVTYDRDEDYIAGYTDSTGEVYSITILSTGSIPASAASLTIGFAVANPAAITDADIYGSVDAQGNPTGIQLVDRVFTDCANIVPQFLNAAGFSKWPAVNAALIAKAASFSGCFSAEAVIDVDTAAVTNYPAVGSWKTTQNINSQYAILCFPMVALAEKIYFLSTQYICTAATVDYRNFGTPIESPSNKNLPACDRLVLANGSTFRLGLQDANTLNGIGVVTARLFGQSGWVLWGNNTTIYPSSTDPVERWIPVARAFIWYGDTLVINTIQFVDRPGLPVQIERLQDSVNLFNNGLVSQNLFLSAKTTFQKADNPINNLLNGQFAWRSNLCTPIPMEVINNLLIYDVSGLNNLFNNSGLASGT